MTRYRAPWGADTIEIRANFAEASCPVEGTNGRQVGDFNHSPIRAMRYAIELEAMHEGFELFDPETIELIDDAVAGMEACEE